VVREAVYLTIL